MKSGAIHSIIPAQAGIQEKTTPAGVILAKAGISFPLGAAGSEIPAFAGMTGGRMGTAWTPTFAGMTQIVIARSASDEAIQAAAQAGSLDCFASLAMTESGL